MAAPFDIAAFQTRLVETRKARKMSLQAVADASGFSKGYVWELENGNVNNPTVRAVWALSAALSISPAYLLGIDPERNELDPLAHQVATLINVELARRERA